MKTSIILFFAIIYSFSLRAQIQWQKCLGGTSGEIANSVVQTFDGGYIVAGASSSNDGDVTGHHGNGDFWVVKLNDAGIIEWQKCLGGTQSDQAYTIIQTIDSGYIVTGYTDSNDGDVSGNPNPGWSDYWIVKLNVVGAIEWQQTLGGMDLDFAESVIQTLEGGYVIAGTSSSIDGDVTGNHGGSDFWIVKLNAVGILEWQKCFGGTANERANSVIQTLDSGFVVAGWSNSNDGDVTGNHGYFDYWLIKLNVSGSIEWQKSLGGTDWDAATSIIQTHDSGYVIAGFSASNDGDVTGNHGYRDYWIVKLNTSGVIQWQHSLGGTGEDEAWSLVQTTESGYIVTGYSDSNDGDVTGNHVSSDYWVVKLNVAGVIEWQKCLGGTGTEAAYSIIQASDSGYVVAGYSESNNGDVTGFLGFRDYWIVKLGQPTGIENLNNSNTFPIYPNPSTHNFSISANAEFDNAQLNVFNTMGSNVYSCRLNKENKVIDAESFASGIYYVQIIKGEKMWAEKILKQ